jgi:hypothetical protein
MKEVESRCPYVTKDHLEYSDAMMDIVLNKVPTSYDPRIFILTDIDLYL